MLLTLAQRKQLFAICCCCCCCTLTLLTHTHTVTCLPPSLPLPSLSSLVCVFESWLHRVAFWQFSCLHSFGNTWLPFGFASTWHTHGHTHVHTLTHTRGSQPGLTVWQLDALTVWQFLSLLGNRKLHQKSDMQLKLALELMATPRKLAGRLCHTLCVCECVCVCTAHKSYLALGYAVQREDDNIQSKCSKSPKFVIRHVRVSSRVCSLCLLPPYYPSLSLTHFLSLCVLRACVKGH